MASIILKMEQVEHDDAAKQQEKLSKRAERKEKRRAHWEQKKEKKKMQRKQKQQEKPAEKPDKELDMSDEAVLRRRERTIAKRESFLMAAEEGMNVIIDCGFEELMTDKEKKSLSQQIMYVETRRRVQGVRLMLRLSDDRFSYGVNRHTTMPVRYTDFACTHQLVLV